MYNVIIHIWVFISIAKWSHNKWLTSITTHSYKTFFLWWEGFRSTFLATFKYVTLLLPRVTMQYICPVTDLFYNWKFVPLTTFTHFLSSHPAHCSEQSPFWQHLTQKCQVTEEGQWGGTVSAAHRHLRESTALAEGTSETNDISQLSENLFSLVSCLQNVNCCVALLGIKQKMQRANLWQLTVSLHSCASSQPQIHSAPGRVLSRTLPGHAALPTACRAGHCRPARLWAAPEEARVIVSKLSWQALVRDSCAFLKLAFPHLWFF